MVAALRPLRLPGFPNLGLAYLVNELGNWLGEIALAVLVYEETGSPLATAALFLGMQFVPALLAQGVVARVEVSGTKVGLPLLYTAEAAAFVFFAAVIPVEIVYAKETLDAGASGYGALLAGWGAGMVAGSLLFAATRRVSLEVLLLFSTLAVGASYLSLSVTQTLL